MLKRASWGGTQAIKGGLMRARALGVKQKLHNKLTRPQERRLLRSVVDDGTLFSEGFDPHLWPLLADGSD